MTFQLVAALGLAIAAPRYADFAYRVGMAAATGSRQRMLVTP